VIDCHLSDHAPLHVSLQFGQIFFPPDPNGGLPKKAITSVNKSQPSQKSLTLIRVSDFRLG
jgi:hypothetical protein